MLEHNVAETNSSTKFPTTMLPTPLVSATFFLEMSAVKSFSNHFGGDVVKPMVLATLVFGNVVKSMVLATLILKML